MQVEAAAVYIYTAAIAIVVPTELIVSGDAAAVHIKCTAAHVHACAISLANLVPGDLAAVHGGAAVFVDIHTGAVHGDVLGDLTAVHGEAAAAIDVHACAAVETLRGIVGAAIVGSNAAVIQGEIALHHHAAAGL